MLTPKHKVGDKVFKAWTERKTFQHDCPDCLGEKQWKAISPAGSEYHFACPRCAARYKSYSDIGLDYMRHTPSVRQLTIGSVRTDSNAKPDEQVSYMCNETGVGSGTIHYECTLFGNKDDAFAKAKEIAREQDDSEEWIGKRFDQSLVLSDFQLLEAMKVSVQRQIDLEESQ